MSLPTDTSVKWFSSLMPGAPSIGTAPGTALAVLDACLITGFGSVTLNTLVVADGIATATVSAGHGFLDWVVIAVNGATPAALNGEKRLCPISPTQFRFDATGIADQTATGTITAKVAPVGWNKLFAGTNKAVYQRTSPLATPMVLRIDDSNAQLRARVYESMSSLDSGVGPMPLTAECYMGRANGTPRAWRLFADDLIVYLKVDALASGWFGYGLTFGDCIPLNSTDAYHCLLIGGSPTTDADYHSNFLNGNTTNRWISRGYSQQGACVGIGLLSLFSAYPGTAGIQGSFNVADGAVHSAHVEIWDEGTRWRRGIQPGFLNLLHDSTGTYDLDTVIDYPDIQNGKAMIVRNYDNRRWLVPIIGPWR